MPVNKYKIITMLLVVLIVSYSSSIVIAQNATSNQPMKAIGPYQIFLGNVNSEPKSQFKPGENLYLWLTGSYTVELSYTIEIYDPSGSLVYHESFFKSIDETGFILLFSWNIPPTAPEGKWKLTLKLSDNKGFSSTDSLYFDVITSKPAQPIQTVTTTQGQGQGISLFMLVGLVGVIILLMIISAILLTSRRKRAQPAPPQPPIPSMPPAPPPPKPESTPPQPSGGETVVVSSQAGSPAAPAITSGGSETLVSLARFRAPNGRVIPITQPRQRFGREDFEGIVPSQSLPLISRKSKPQFEIYFDPAAKQWFIVDSNSSNGTIVNGQNIKGKGPVPLNNGDVVSPAGVVELKFETY